MINNLTNINLNPFNNKQQPIRLPNNDYGNSTETKILSKKQLKTAGIIATLITLKFTVGDYLFKKICPKLSKQKRYAVIAGLIAFKFLIFGYIYKNFFASKSPKLDKKNNGLVESTDFKDFLIKTNTSVL